MCIYILPVVVFKWVLSATQNNNLAHFFWGTILNFFLRLLYMTIKGTYPCSHPSWRKASYLVLEIDPSHTNNIHLICRVVQGSFEQDTILVRHVTFLSTPLMTEYKIINCWSHLRRKTSKYYISGSTRRNVTQNRFKLNGHTEILTHKVAHHFQ